MMLNEGFTGATPDQRGTRPPPRERLANRRPHATAAVEWQRREWLMSVGFDRAGWVREVFVKGLKAGSALDAIMDDACVLLSLLLQAGYTVYEVDRHLGREGVDPTAPAASPLGLLTQVAASLEQKSGQDIRTLHRQLGELV